MNEWAVLTLTQPFATLVVFNLKRIETRRWATTYHGPLLIHAGLGPGYFGTEAALWEYCASEPCRTALAAHGITSAGQLPRGAIIGRSTLLSVEAIGPGDEELDGYWRLINGTPMHWPLSAQERAFGDFSPDRWAYLLAEATPLATPIPARGLPGLWRWQGTLDA